MWEALFTASATFRALRHRNFRLFWYGQMVSLAGTWMQRTAQAWLVLTLTDSAFKLGLIGTLQFAPVLFLSLIGGVVADRYPKRKIIIATQSGLAVFALILSFLALTGRVQYWHVAVMALCGGIARSFDSPARQSFFVEMTSKDDLLNAIALNSSAFNLARIAGPALAGVAIKLVGTGWAFFFNGISYFAVIYALFIMDTPDRVRPTRNNAVEEIKSGLAYIRRSRSVIGIIGFLGVISVLALNWNVLVPLLAKNSLGLDSSGYGLLMAAMGLGALLGALVLATYASRGPQMKPVMFGALALGAAQALLCLVHSPLTAAALLFFCGAAMVIYMSSSNTTVQATVPDRLRGRVMSVYFLVLGGATPLGALLTGALAERYGAPATFAIVGAVSVLAATAFLALRLLPTPTPEESIDDEAEPTIVHAASTGVAGGGPTPAGSAAGLGTDGEAVDLRTTR